MKTLEELLQTVEVIEIDINRVMDVPESVRKVGTQFDHEVTTLVFHAPRYSQNGEDLSNTIPYVSFYKANKDVGRSLCENLIVDPNNAGMIYFTWTLRRPATDIKGALPFVVCMRRADGDGLDMAWHSELNTDLYVPEGIDCDIEDFEPEFKDEVTRILLDISAVVEKIKSDAESGAFDGQDVTHRWDGTTLIVTSASGTSSSDLKGDNATLEIGTLKSTEKVNNLKVYFVTAAEYDELINSDDFDESALYITPETAYVTHEWNGTVLTISSNAGTSSVDLKGDKGDKGDAGHTPQKGVDYFDGTSVTHSWNGTTLTVTSASGTSSANLKGEKGDKGDKGDSSVTSASITSALGYTPANPNTIPSKTETWTFTLEDGSTVNKVVYVG